MFTRAGDSRRRGDGRRGRHTRRQHVEAVLRQRRHRAYSQARRHAWSHAATAGHGDRRSRHQAVIADPAGAVTGIWQAGSSPGFTVIHEHATPSFIAIDVRDYHTEIAFYRQVFGWHPLEEEVDGHHYAGYIDLDSNRPIAGIGDEVESLAPGQSPQWSVFWQTDDLDASVAKNERSRWHDHHRAHRRRLGRVARVADPAGARFRLFKPEG